MSDIDYNSEIPKLVDAIDARIDSDENRRRQALWEKDGRPVTRPDKIPVTVSPEFQMWAAVTGVNLIDFYDATHGVALNQGTEERIAHGFALQYDFGRPDCADFTCQLDVPIIGAKGQIRGGAPDKAGRPTL